MTFFEPLPPVKTVDPKPKRVRWRGDDTDTLGVAVECTAVLAQTDELAIVFAGVTAYQAGFSFSVLVFSRLEPPRVSLLELVNGHMHRRHAAPGPDTFRFGMRFSDGTRLSDSDLGPSYRKRTAPVATEHLMDGRGSHANNQKYRCHYWVEPLPPPGEILLVCEWNEVGISESSVTIDAQTLLAAAQRAKPLWPADVGLPRPSVRWSERGSKGKTRSE